MLAKSTDIRVTQQGIFSWLYEKLPARLQGLWSALVKCRVQSRQLTSKHKSLAPRTEYAGYRRRNEESILHLYSRRTEQSKVRQEYTDK